MKKLTRRQQQFLSKFLDLYNKERESLHYTALAEYVGVSKISAYEMLRLLEEHGLVEAEYELPADQRGPGRASVMYRPTALAGPGACPAGRWRREPGRMGSRQSTHPAAT